ncbi:MAG: hypothetical protein KC421_17555 [Anaerolineales bacterium]|nr:hypothetical protein [Anaerolineales bacterium]
MNKNRIILGTRKGLIVLHKSGTGWETRHTAFPGVPISYAMVDHRHDTLWACADHGHWGQKLYRSHDGGATLTEVPAPKYPDDATIYDVFSGGEEKPATVTYLWTIVPGGDDQPQRLYIGTEPGGLFVSNDGGETFELMMGLWNHPSRQNNWFGGGRDQAGCCSIVVDPRDSSHLFVSISVGGVYESVDGGMSWNGRNRGLVADFLPDPHAEYGHDGHCLVAAPANPDILWQQNHCGVFRSADGGQNWDNLSKGKVKFGFPVVVDEQDSNTAWVVPAVSDEVRTTFDGALFVARTEDGGQSWHELRTGLPQDNCFDVTFRHALDLAGDTLIFGTTTGNLFISTNRGDTWDTVGSYFPPIYSVRFAA